MRGGLGTLTWVQEGARLVQLPGRAGRRTAALVYGGVTIALLTLSEARHRELVASSTMCMESGPVEARGSARKGSRDDAAVAGNAPTGPGVGTVPEHDTQARGVPAAGGAMGGRRRSRRGAEVRREDGASLLLVRGASAGVQDDSP